MDGVGPWWPAPRHRRVAAAGDATTNLTLLTIAQRYSTEEAAHGYFQRVRWPEGPVCPHCKNADQERVYKLTENDTSDKKRRVRPGLFKCAECRQTFTVTVGTVMEDSKIPLTKWLLAFYMMASSKTPVVTPAAETAPPPVAPEGAAGPAGARHAPSRPIGGGPEGR